MFARTSIDEANKHLGALHKRIYELENTVKEQHEALVIKDEYMHNKFDELKRSKDKEMEGVKSELTDTKCIIKELQDQIHKKDTKIKHLQAHKENLNVLFHTIPDLKKVVQTIETVKHNFLKDEGTLNHFKTVPDNLSPKHSAVYAETDNKWGRKSKHKTHRRAASFSHLQNHMSLSSPDEESTDSTSHPSQDKEFYL